MNVNEFVAWQTVEKVRQQRQAKADYATKRATEKEQGETWTRILSRPVAGEPAPEPMGLTLDDLALMDHEKYGAQRPALGISDGSDFPGTSSWSDRAQARIAAQHAATTRPETELDKYTQERAALGVKDVGDVIGDPRGNLRRYKSPWQL